MLNYSQKNSISNGFNSILDLGSTINKEDNQQSLFSKEEWTEINNLQFKKKKWKPLNDSTEAELKEIEENAIENIKAAYDRYSSICDLSSISSSSIFGDIDGKTQIFSVFTTKKKVSPYFLPPVAIVHNCLPIFWLPQIYFINSAEGWVMKAVQLRERHLSLEARYLINKGQFCYTVC
ncbi:hypothetical protein BDB01DRAFT_893491 [Pilobolus umbonatus]|nr:hypothetical protein BDB01DRAFT_893491 [Pilobolus umbonatus]